MQNRLYRDAACAVFGNSGKRVPQENAKAAGMIVYLTGQLFETNFYSAWNGTANPERSTANSAFETPWLPGNRLERPLSNFIQGKRESPRPVSVKRALFGRSLANLSVSNVMTFRHFRFMFAQPHPPVMPAANAAACVNMALYRSGLSSENQYVAPTISRAANIT